jgi:ATP-dependent DNA helicase RecQ
VTAQPRDILQQYWGYANFRPMQDDIIQSVLDGTDTLALLPTGGGKSLCFQVPALCKEGITIVVSPLIALMKDQVYNLKRRGIPAVAIFSGMRKQEIDIVFENACQGAYKLLYMSPERLKTDLAQARLLRMNVNLIAIDEAHCISQWGYDFRPPYLQIAEIRALLPGVPVLALTATATPTVAQDIQDKLDFKNQKVFQQSFFRDNLSYAVLYETKKYDKLIDILQKVPGSGIIYMRSRGDTQKISDLLRKKGISSDFYHAGLSLEDRNKKQEAWIKGNPRIMVCTNAFGMGIDKPDVRLVVHLTLPDSLEAYFQEAGRGGRDGKKSYAVLVYTETDADQLRKFFEASYPSFDLIRRIYQALGSYSQIAIGSGVGESVNFDFQQFCHTYKLEQPVAHAALRLLEQEGWIAQTDAAATASKLLIKCNRETLYDYQIRNKQADAVIKVLLRQYPGIQHDFIEISEGTIANLLKTPLENVLKVIHHAEKENILDYYPRNEKPQVTFFRERVTAENLSIDLEKFNFRRENAYKRVESSILYAERKHCRSRQLLAYFGEMRSEKCGICDLCTGRNEADLNEETLQAYQRKITDLLKVEPLPFEEILKAFSPKKHETVTAALSYLCEEGILQESDECFKIVQ